MVGSGRGGGRERRVSGGLRLWSRWLGVGKVQLSEERQEKCGFLTAAVLGIGVVMRGLCRGVILLLRKYS